MLHALESDGGRPRPELTDLEERVVGALQVYNVAPGPTLRTIADWIEHGEDCTHGAIYRLIARGYVTGRQMARTFPPPPMTYMLTDLGRRTFR